MKIIRADSSSIEGEINIFLLNHLRDILEVKSIDVKKFDDKKYEAIILYAAFFKEEHGLQRSDQSLIDNKLYQKGDF